MLTGITENGASVAERNTQGRLAGELAASRRIARAIAGLHGEPTEEVHHAGASCVALSSYAYL